MPPIRSHVQKGSYSDAVDIAPSFYKEEEDEVEIGGGSRIVFIAFLLRALFLVYLHYHNYQITDQIITFVGEAARARK